MWVVGGRGDPQPQVKRKSSLITATGILAVVAVVGGLVAAGGSHADRAQPVLAVHTVKVVRGDLSAMVSVAGTLTYRAQPDGSPYVVVNEARGTVTELPAPGHVIRQGQVLYRVDGRPVVLLYGATPAYRTLSLGASGDDVKALNADLVSLGYATARELGPSSDSYDSASEAGVRRLQAAVAAPVTGTLTLGEALFEPSAMRVTSLDAYLGGSSRPGQSVLQATTTSRQVQVALDASQQTDVAVGDKVTITLPDDRTTPGVVASVASVATCGSASGAGGPAVSSGGTGADTCGGSNPNSSSPTIAVVVRPSRPTGTGDWDQAPVQVGITTDRIRDALSVPVTALIAQTDGGYAVEVAGPGSARRLEPVTLGLFDDADGLVQVTHSDLTVGDEVVVPDS